MSRGSWMDLYSESVSESFLNPVLMLLNFEIQGYYQRQISFLFPVFPAAVSICITLASQCDLGLSSIFTLKED